MTQEDKELLLKDLCARLPYGVFINFEKTHNIFPLTSIKMEEMFPLNDFQVLLNDKYPIQWCKPYLRPMSSITEDEANELDVISDGRLIGGGEYLGVLSQHDWTDSFKYILLGINWLNSHMFDYRGLISKGLALEAPEGMYNFN